MAEPFLKGCGDEQTGVSGAPTGPPCPALGAPSLRGDDCSFWGSCSMTASGVSSALSMGASVSVDPCQGSSRDVLAPGPSCLGDPRLGCAQGTGPGLGESSVRTLWGPGKAPPEIVDRWQKVGDPSFWHVFWEVKLSVFCESQVPSLGLFKHIVCG